MYNEFKHTAVAFGPTRPYLLVKTGTKWDWSLLLAGGYPMGSGAFRTLDEAFANTPEKSTIIYFNSTVEALRACVEHIDAN